MEEPKKKQKWIAQGIFWKL